jgi:hypothetical protein
VDTPPSGVGGPHGSHNPQVKRHPNVGFFSAMMGALKVKDEAEVNLDVALPAASS